ncbi:pyrroloquinoline quinone biosynthesis protein PqqF [Pseudomonas kuykendallii]|uniref:Coenzyme PQQ biosynthesis probable peptidase PqqF n=1 Tax=Pseudomonas kuykendallii TaxID=1007099 RepID=A0A1H3B4G1_9PSED|nr:pyrroloquinoline quinone biosynthesis protein PqqF [Pseudomonas kuykendallii]MCQ4270048.1 pyrroloquinoline quinone biosynthesis protein PqqF [Pseudomonas kuykendallii]SDX36910.1 coenzyme PQQ biosynthesis probable peptidase PqqF [Pseudomonas kuykendallii]
MTDIAEHAPVIQRRMTLDNGLAVTLLQVPQAQHCAAWVRVAAGSHDEPREYPGLAHFLEHLLFLDSAGFPADQGLMAFVQGVGGQVNASTQARHTDFFCEVPPLALDGALARLFDMLARPALDPGAQRREREVLQAEFLARGEDRETLMDGALGLALAAHHPFGDFHAGNRETLPVEEETFQQALHGFHRRFYHAGQAHVLIAGAQPLDALAALAKRHGRHLAPGARVSTQPPALRLEPAHVEVQAPGPTQLALYFPLVLPTAAGAALECLFRVLRSAPSGGLQATLRERGYAERVSPRRVYRADDQALIAIDIEGASADEATWSEIVTLLFSWLEFFATRSDWADVREQEFLIRSVRWQTCSALDAVRMAVEKGGNEPVEAPALAALLTQLTPGAMVSVVTSTRELPLLERPGFALRARCSKGLSRARGAPVAWCLPERNPFLKSAAAPRAVCPVPAGLRWQNDADIPPGHAALFLRWRWSTPVADVFAGAAQAALAPLVQAAGEAGVELRLQCSARDWVLSLGGLASVVDRVLPEALKILRQPTAEDWRDALDPAPRAAGGMLLRQLLDELPGALQGSVSVAELPADALPGAWRALYHQARWDAFGLGQPSPTINAVLGELPGQGLFEGVSAVNVRSTCRWIEVAGQKEQALLLFARQAGLDAPAEAAWRLLGNVLQGAFYTYMRTDLQLGYGVYCGYRQVGEEAGLLFAVQSPKASVAEIFGHLLAFLEGQQERLGQLTDEALETLREPMAAQLWQPPATFRALAEARWALYAQPGKQPAERIARCVQELNRAALLDALACVRQAQAGWLALANAAPPDPRWSLG